MIGNVAEWCSDWYADDISLMQEDPKGPNVGAYRVIKGGAWGSNAINCRAADRSRNDPAYWNSSLGFRPALVQSTH